VIRPSAGGRCSIRSGRKNSREVTHLLASRYTRLACLAVVLYSTPALTSAVECSTIEFQGTRSTICHVDTRTEHLRLFSQDPAGKPLNSFKRVTESLKPHEQLAFAMNAGMYREDYSAVGLLVIDGRQLHRLNLASGYGNFYLKPNGVFILSASGPAIVESSDYRTLTDPVLLATQSGPLLLQHRQINPALNPQGTSRLIRNGVGLVTATELVFAISDDPVSFYEFALLFRDRLHCTDALYLDGNVSSLYARSLGRDDEVVPLGPIFGVTTSDAH
jgi:uncharacterized protein YigE (DUF2233 family)